MYYMFNKKKKKNLSKNMPDKKIKEKPYETEIDISKLLDMEVPEFSKWWNDEGEKQTDNRAPLTNLPAFYLLSLIHLKQIRHNVRKIAKFCDKENK